MALSLTRFDSNEHTMTINLGVTEIRVRHLADIQISALRTNFPALEGAQDTTGEPLIETT